ncbi:hypothetical protein MVEN_00339100 [Mycena venus]|uniref:MYND-type domain-containing protein n=1 Tax=Mycena venus TaxID=2733690 RepID=A0A8H6YP55_9AGAR|nr:hypothetical protein MVEN_00339100 [Mycena venus]
MSTQWIQKSIKQLQESPKEVLEKARRGSIADLSNLANFWQEVPDLLSLGILNVFFLHLNADKAFEVPSEANDRSPMAERAFCALLGLCKSADCFLPGAPHHRDPAVLKAWPGIFKWSAFFFKMRVISPNRPAERRRVAMDLIATVWYSLTRAEGLREAIATTKGTVEIATHLWLLDDEPGSGPKYMNIPCVAAALDAILIDRSTTDRALATGGGTPDPIVKIAMSRTRSALSRSPLDPTQVRASSRFAPVLQAHLRARSTPGGDVALLNGIISGFGYLSNCLQSTEGFTWVTQSLAADLLLALADSSPHFARLDEEDYEMVCSLLKETLPTYLVYRSVIQAVDDGMQRLGPEQRKRITSSVFKDVWLDFQKLAEERLFVVVHAAAVKGKAATCDNVECHKVDAKNTFRKCGGCSSTLYCSKECQTIAWKQGGHKTMCKMKQRERLEGKSQAISKSDAAFFHNLATRDARHHLPLLRRLARAKYPTLRSGELLICIDYTVVPSAYSVVPLTEADRHNLRTNGSANAEARTDALLERARENPDRFGLIQSKIVNGVGLQLVLSVVTGDFWTEGFEFGDSEDFDGESESTRDRAVDDVDFMMARTALNRFLAAQGQPPAF